MSRMWNANLNRNMLAKAYFFDKRFEKIEKFLEDDEAERVLNEVKDEAERLVREHQVESPPPEEVTRKKRRFLGIGLMEQDEGESAPAPSQSAAEEVMRYRREPMIAEDSCPFSWWRSRRKDYPLLARLARKYLSIPGTSTPSERVISRLNLVLSKRRLQMKGDFVSKIMFMQDCI